MKKLRALNQSKVRKAINQGSRKVKSISQKLKPISTIGKNGLDDKNINHLLELLKTKKLIKIRILDSALDAKKEKKIQIKEIANTLVTKMKCKIIRTIGSTITLRK